jgi:murein L,D-transpeptidase YcbB/YkuD
MVVVSALCTWAAPSHADALSTSLQDQLVHLPPAAPTSAPDRAALLRYYADRKYRPVWADEAGPTRAATRAIAEIARAADWGFDSKDFPTAATKAPFAGGRWTPDQTAAADIEITSNVLTYARQARGGRIADPENLLSAYLDRKPVLLEPSAVLAQVTTSAEPDSVLRSYQPQQDQFKRLQAIYAKMRAEAAPPPDAELPLDGPYLVPGTKSPEISILRRRLKVAGTASSDDLYDHELAIAVSAFQQSASLDNDGVVGPATRRALNRGDDDKLNRIRANMEQWRWMPPDLGSTYLFVNIPAFSIDYIENGTAKFQERIIVGKEETPTPVFSKTMTMIVLRPSWVLPDSIKLEKLRRAQRNGTPIENEGYKVRKGKKIIPSWSVDWDKANLSAYQIFQPSGGDNALGQVKFLFPNKHSVYLHDTPNKSLFSASERLFSHGCVRLRNPLSLAQLLLDADKGDETFDARRATRSGPVNNEVPLSKPVPMHIGYFTVWADADGNAAFLGDPYGHELRVRLALEQKWKDIDRQEAPEIDRDTSNLKISAPMQMVSPSAGPSTVTSGFMPPSGITRIPGVNGIDSVKYSKYVRSRPNTVGDMIRSSLMPR